MAYRALHSDSLDTPRRSDPDDEGVSLLDTMGDTDSNLDRVLEHSELESILARSRTATA